MEEKKWEKPFMITIWCITLVLVLIGLAIHVGGWFGFDLFSKPEKTVANTASFDAGEIKEISLDVELGQVTLQRGAEFKVDYNYPEKYAPKIEMKSETLEITEKAKKFTPSSGNEFYLNITVPSNAELKNVDMEINLGELNIDGLTSDRISVEGDCGALKITNCNAENADFQADLGDIEISGCSFRSLKSEADLGDINVQGDFDSVYCRCDMGDIDINTVKNESDIDITAKCSLGNVKVNGKSWH
ncbi:MAG: DUF4097 family beta strand repeat protein [Lachnospiraceae bacterium]|nr:DUF4097 family beta strand repeat protein [Lachnospiraceae bacterium]